jgi:hypothetical protein
VTDLGNIPSEESWIWKDSPYLDLDSAWAKGKFCGKSLDEVAIYFEDAVMGAQEDLMYMPAIPLQYYMFAFAHFLTRTDRSDCWDNSDGASCFLLLLKSKLEEFPEFILPVMERLMPVAEYVASNQELFKAGVDIYGSFPDLLIEIKDLYAEAKLKTTDS